MAPRPPAKLFIACAPPTAAINPTTIPAPTTESHLPQNHPHDLHRLRAQRHANPNFIRPLAHNVRHHAVSPHRREQQRQRRHRSQQVPLHNSYPASSPPQASISTAHQTAQDSDPEISPPRATLRWPSFPALPLFESQRRMAATVSPISHGSATYSFGHRRVAQTLLLHITNNSDNTKLHEVLKIFPIAL